MKKTFSVIVSTLIMLLSMLNICYADSSTYNKIPSSQQIWIDSDNGVMYLPNGPAMRNPDGTPKIYNQQTSIYTNIVTFDDVAKSFDGSLGVQGFKQPSIKFYVDQETMNMYYAIITEFGYSNYNLMMNPDGTAKKYNFNNAYDVSIISSAGKLLVEPQTNIMFWYNNTNSSLTLLYDESAKPRFYNYTNTSYFPTKLSFPETVLVDFENGVIYHNYNGFLYSLQNEDGSQDIYDFSKYNSNINKINTNNIIVDSENNVMYLKGTNNTIYMKDVNGLPKINE